MRTLQFAVAVALVALLAGCSDPDVATNPSGDHNATVTLRDSNYNPTTVNIAAGSAVAWKNEGTLRHTVTADDGSFDSGDMAAGASYTHEFDEAGTYAYHCEYHPSMKGTIKVA